MSVVMLTKTPLQANLSYTQAGRDRFESGNPAGSVRGLAWADQAGTLYLEESDDGGGNWSQTATVSVSASTTTSLPWTALTKQLYRFRYVNGASAQTKLRLIQHTRDMELTDTMLIGSSVPNAQAIPVQLSGSNVEVANGEDAATKSALVAGKSSAGKQVPLNVDADGKLTVGIDQTTPGTTNKVVAELSGRNLQEATVLNVTLAGIRQQLPDIVCGEIMIIAKRGNTGYIYVGNGTVSSTDYGVELGELDCITLPVNNANQIYIDASVSGEGISYVTV